MKKKYLLILLATLSMVSILATGCGDNKLEKVTVEVQPETQTEVTKPEAQPEDQQQEPTEEVEATEEAPITEATEVVEVEVPEQEVDYLAENGITITPCGEMQMPLAYYNSDETHDKGVVTSIEVVPSDEEGYSDTIFTAKIDVASTGTDYLSTYCIYDRYTGLDLTYISEDVSFVNQSGSHKEVCVVEVDGKQYDCSFTFSSDKSSNEVWVVTLTLHHPSDYDGAVFQMGSQSATRKAFEDSLDSSVQRKLADYPELMKDQFYFTATGK